MRADCWCQSISRVVSIDLECTKIEGMWNTHHIGAFGESLLGQCNANLNGCVLVKTSC